MFDINTENFASYFKIQQGTTQLADTPYKASSDSTLSFDSSYSTVSAYEFGMVYATRFMNMRFGLEVVKPPNLKEIKATNAAGTELFSVNSNVTVVAPKIGLEANLKQWKLSRVFLAMDYGSATATIENIYTFTSAGTTAYGLSDFREELRATGTMLEYGLGFEYFIFDTTTMVIDAGYRQLSFASATHNIASTGFQGTVAKGDAAKNTDASARSNVFTGSFASIWFRFWIQ